MREHLLSILFVIIANNCFSQTFQKSVNPGFPATTGNVAVLPDSSYTYGFTRGGDPYVLHFDSAGNFIWGHRYQFGSTPPYGDVNNFSALPGGGYIMDGIIDGNYTAFFFSRLDSAGNVLWSKSVDGTHMDYAGGSVITPEGSLYFTGYDNHVYWPYMVKSDLNGNVQFTRTYQFACGRSSLNEAFDLARLSSNAYFMTGNVDTESSKGRQIMLMRTDSLGNPLWSKIYGGPGVDIGSSVCVSSDSNLLITGYTGYGMGAEDIFVMKVDTNGNTIWFKTFGTSANERGTRITQLSDGRICILGWSTANTAPNKQQVVLYLDSAGNEITCRFLDLNYSFTPGRYNELDNGAFICSIYNYSSVTAPFIEKVNNSGRSGCNEHFASLPSLNVVPSWANTSVTWSNSPIVANVTSQVFNGPNILTTTHCSSSCTANAAFTCSAHVICHNDSVSFSASDSSALTYEWYVNNILLDTNLVSGIRCAVPGIYQVKLIVNNGSCIDSAIQIFQVDSFVVAGLSTSQQYMQVHFTNLSIGATSWFWDFGDGSYSGEFQPNHLYNDTGAYSGYLIATNACGSDSLNFVFAIYDTTLTLFRKTYGWTTELQVGYSITQMKDGGYAVCGYNHGAMGVYSDHLVCKFKQDGTLAWSKIFESSNSANYSDTGTAITETLESGIIFGGRSNGLISVINLDSSGNVIWSYILNIGGRVKNIIALPDSTYIVGGSQGNYAYLLCLDWYGNRVWMRTYNGGSCSDFVRCADGGFALVGKSALGSDLFVLKTDSSGVGIWAKNIVSSNIDQGIAITSTDNNGFVVTGAAVAPSNPNYSVMYEFDSTGTCLWGRKLSAAQYSLTPQWVYTYTDETIFLITEEGNSNLIRLDSIGNIQWSKNIPGAKDAIVTRNNRIVCAGLEGLSYQDVTVFAMDTSSYMGCLMTPDPTISSTGISTTSVTADHTHILLTPSRIHFFVGDDLPMTETILCFDDSCNPHSSFSYNTISDTVNFTSTSLGPIQIYHWSFGDGDTSNLINPSHYYANPGLYNVCLVTQSQCGQLDSTCAQVYIGITIAIAADQPTINIGPNPSTEYLDIRTTVATPYSIEILNSAGELCDVHTNISNSTFNLNISNYPEGIYLIKIVSENNLPIITKFVKLR